MKTEEKEELGSEILEQKKGSVNGIFHTWDLNISSGTSDMSGFWKLNEK